MKKPTTPCAACGALFVLEPNTPRSSQAWLTRYVDPQTMQVIDVRHEVEVYFFCKSCCSAK